MTDPATDTANGNVPAKPERQEMPFWKFLLLLAGGVLVLRSFIFSPFNIPSESMLPRLLNGDYLIASKWSYGFSRHSLPLGLPLLPEKRLFPSQPERGDVVIFKAPPLNDTDYIKRVIGLPGDTVQMIGGVLHLNGQPVPKVRLADFEIAVSPNTDCYASQYAAKAADGTDLCRYPRFRETLPGGVSYEVIDFGQRPQDDTLPVMVGEGMLFLMGDNRDNSEDSRFEAVPGGGIGLVPQENLVGQARFMMFSTDGGAAWHKPWTWFSAARWDRIGGAI